MTIKEVEKLTGLTAKSIRYYEAKGLLTVERNEGNSYRSYSENEVNRLNWIKLFRYLDFSIEEIRQLLDKGEEQVKEALKDKAETFAQNKNICEDKQEMCLSLAKDYKAKPEIIQEYNETIEFLESDEIAEIIERLKDVGCPNLPVTIISTMICLGPILWLAVIVALLVGIEKLISPKNYLFYEHQPIASIVMIWLIMIPVILVCLLLCGKIFKRTREDLEGINDIVCIWNHLGKWRLAVIFLWLVGLYCCVTSVTFVTEDSIIYRSPMNPAGTTYGYSDVEKITTGFGDKTFAIAEYKKKGNFFYQIVLDGKKITFHVPSVNEEIERYQEDSYLELEEFDQKLFSLGIFKTASEEGYENCDLDQQFVERFLRIIRLK
ncbi:MAG: MerR family transcriptional regulator [Lachnospiraceae bacterium]|nr:MerR family transcriptional regulator [Lachnospiraceae bacterium]